MMIIQLYPVSNVTRALNNSNEWRISHDYILRFSLNDLYIYSKVFVEVLMINLRCLFNEFLLSCIKNKRG